MISELWAPLADRQPQRRGGWRQRLRDEEDAEAAETRISKLMGGLLRDWCDGLLSASRLQQCASDCVSDGFLHPMVSRMSRVGGGQHAQEGLLRLLSLCGVPQHLAHFPGETISEAMLPSSWIRLLAEYPHEFKLRLGADRRKLQDFWADFLGRPANREVRLQHPVLCGLTSEELSNVVPLTLHADAGPYSKTSSCYCISFSGLLAVGDEQLVKYLCSSHIKGEGGRIDTFWAHLISDFTALGCGKVGGCEIARDAEGNLWRFALLYCKSDEEARCNDFGFAHFSAAAEICSECLANRTNRPFTDLRESAAWRPSENMDFATYKMRVRVPPHPLCDSAFFCHRNFFVLDFMHLADCKGVAALTFGGVLMHLLRDARLGQSKAARLDRINAERQAHYNQRPGVATLPRIMMGNVVQAGWGDLHGPAYKAANTRQASPFFRELVHKFCVSGSPCDQCLRSVVASLDNVYAVLYSAGAFLTQDSMETLRAHVLEFGLSYQRLRELSRRSEVSAFPVRPKIHKFQHIPFLAEFINPRVVQAYGEESLVGTVTKTWKGSVAGRYRARVQEMVLVKRVTALLLRFELACAA